jgi:hypothetical protein
MLDQTPAPTSPTRNDQVRVKLPTDIPPKVLRALAAAQLAAESGKATLKANDGQLSFTVFSVDDVMRVARPAFKKANLAIIPVGKWLRSRQDIPGVGFTAVVRYAIIADDECAFCELESPVFSDPSKELPHRIAGAETYAKKKWYEGILGLIHEDPSLPLEPNGPVNDTRGSYLDQSTPSTTTPAAVNQPIVARSTKKRDVKAAAKGADAVAELPEDLRPFAYEIYKKSSGLSPRVQLFINQAFAADTYAKMDKCINLFQTRASEISAEESEVARAILVVRKVEVNCATRPARLLQDWNDLHVWKEKLPKSDFDHLLARLAQALKDSDQAVPSDDASEDSSSSEGNR